MITFSCCGQIWVARPRVANAPIICPLCLTQIASAPPTQVSPRHPSLLPGAGESDLPDVWCEEHLMVHQPRERMVRCVKPGCGELTGHPHAVCERH